MDEGADITLMITLSWLTDANDVDLHVIDPNKESTFGPRSGEKGLCFLLFVRESSKQDSA